MFLPSFIWRWFFQIAAKVHIYFKTELFHRVNIWWQVLSLCWLYCLWIVFLFCFCGAFFVFAVLVFMIVGFLVCKVGIDKSVFVSFTDGVCLWHRWCLCMDGSAIFLGLDCAFWWLHGKCCLCERCRCGAMFWVKEVPPDGGFVLLYYDSMVCVAGGLCLGVCCFFGFIGRCAFMLSCCIYN